VKLLAITALRLYTAGDAVEVGLVCIQLTLHVLLTLATITIMKFPSLIS